MCARQKIFAVGMGPGSLEAMTLAAKECIEEADVIVGYTTYVDLLKTIFPHKTFEVSGMRDEIGRTDRALALALEKKRVVLVSGGDAGVYGLSGLLYERAEKKGLLDRVEVVPVCGVTAALSGGAILGAPITNDFVCISLSDHLTPAPVIEERLFMAAKADLCTVLYNPRSRTRKDVLSRACEIFLQYREKSTVCGIASKIARPGEQKRILSLEELHRLSLREGDEIDMQSTVFIGNSTTRVIQDAMVTPRGYQNKYQS